IFLFIRLDQGSPNLATLRLVDFNSNSEKHSRLDEPQERSPGAGERSEASLEDGAPGSNLTHLESSHLLERLVEQDFTTTLH
uniref:Uncharacterized protein n=1 Tax=Laticauda laticaudata TaxID=8630 RepID=A0A8C5WX03_LATLA